MDAMKLRQKMIERVTTPRDREILAPPHRVLHVRHESGVDTSLMLSIKPTRQPSKHNHNISLHFLKNTKKISTTAKMGLPQQTTTPIEKPSTSETAENMTDSTPAANISTQNSSIGATNTSELAGGAIGGTEGDAERAAEKLYEERMEVSDCDDCYIVITSADVFTGGVR